MPSRYSDDVLAARRARRDAKPAEVAADRGLLAEHRVTGFAGRVTNVDAASVTLRDMRGKQRHFRLSPGAFRVNGRTVTLVRPRPTSPPARPAVTASGSVAPIRTQPRVARASRIYVEGIHDAELLEKVWGDDLRDAGVVVEPLGGIDDLAGAVRAFGPAPHRRLGVLVDHLLPGTKEQRTVAGIDDPHVLITGHPYVDVWQGVRPRTVGIPGWPTVPRGQPWKEGVCTALGVEEPPAFWRRLLRSVATYADLEQPLVGAVEQLLDFVAPPED
ncbi:MAG: DUF3097 domain-containing protein [Actinobacteria bacterium]|nr:DUF3097 domain-containing protein [Actinomycetota bacterium]